MPKLFAAVARRDITPPLGTPLFGYPQARAATEVADPLGATALVVRSGDTTAAIVSLDWGQVAEDEVEEIRAAVNSATGIEPQNITLCATHTHSGPETVSCWGWAEKNVAYMESARRPIAEAVAAAFEALQPARIGIAVVPTDIGINRRMVALDGSVGSGFNEWGPRDPDLTVVRFEGEIGPIVQLVHVGAHPTSRGLDPAISRDWPGVMMDRLETITGVPVLFINGAFGDVQPRTTCGGYVGDGAPAANEVGLRAASHAIRAWHSIKEFREVEVQVHNGTFELPYAPLEPLEEAQRQLEARAGQQNARGEEGCEYGYWNAVYGAHQSPLQSSHPFAQTITTLGPLAFVPFAGEIFSEIALRIKDASPFQHTLCAGTSNGGHGYYVTREARHRGGYEVWVAKAYSPYLLAENIDDVLVAENVRLLHEFNDRKYVGK